MVYYFTTGEGETAVLLYMGKDKYENEDLIKYGWPEDVWFHVDNISSAHVYARLPKGMTIENMPDDMIRDCCQLVKANSIEGCKKPSVVIVYTPWSNLKKTGGMDVGQVGFHQDRLVRKYVVAEKDKDVLKRIGKTKDERYPNLADERARRDEEERSSLKQEFRQRSKAEKELDEQRRKEKEARSYSSLFKGAAATAGAGGGKNAKGAGGASGGGGGYGYGGEEEVEEQSGDGSGTAQAKSATEDVVAAKQFEDDFM